MTAKYEVQASDLLKARVAIEQKAHLVEVAKSVQKELVNSFSPKVAIPSSSPKAVIGTNCRSNYCDPVHTLRSSTSIQSLLNI